MPPLRSSVQTTGVSRATRAGTIGQHRAGKLCPLVRQTGDNPGFQGVFATIWPCCPDKVGDAPLQKMNLLASLRGLDLALPDPMKYLGRGVTSVLCGGGTRSGSSARRDRVARSGEGGQGRRCQTAGKTDFDGEGTIMFKVGQDG
jgi:hypothetical protein